MSIFYNLIVSAARKTRVLLAIFASLLIGGCTTPRIFLEPVPTLGTETESNIGLAVQGFVVRQRSVILDRTVFPSGDRVIGPTIINLFPNLEVKVSSWTRIDQGVGLTVWHGATNDPEVRHIAMSNEDGRIVMSIHRAAFTYRVEPVRNEPFEGKHVVMELNASVLPPEAEPLLPPPQSELPEETPKTVECDAPSSIPGNPAPKPKTIKVLVAYTRETILASPSIDQDIALLIDQLNTVWGYSSNFSIDAELAGSYETSYVATNDFKKDLTSITDASDGKADEMHAIRNEKKADLVVLLVEGLQSCGIAWRPQLPLRPLDQDYAFSVVNRVCGLNNFTFSHEIGHNFGMRHDRIADGMPQGGGFGFGYIDMPSRLISVMAYYNVCEDAGIRCTRVPQHSSPNYSIADGRPFGVSLNSPAAANNFEVLCRGADTVSKYR